MGSCKTANAIMRFIVHCRYFADNHQIDMASTRFCMIQIKEGGRKILSARGISLFCNFAIVAISNKIVPPSNSAYT